MAHYPIGTNIKQILTSVNTVTADAQEARFFGTGGSIIMVESAFSYYKSGGHPDGRTELNGTIYIGTYAVDAYAKAAQIPPNQAAKALAMHEMGHADINKGPLKLSRVTARRWMRKSTGA